jgi:hypothetical protein
MRRPRLLLGPEVLYASASHLVWHHGVVEGPRGISAVLEVLHRPAGDPTGTDLSDEVWRDFGREVKAVSALAYGDGAPATGGCFGSERRRSYTFGFGEVRAAGLRLDFIVRPLGLHVLRQLPDAVASQPRGPVSAGDPVGPRFAVLREPEVLHGGDGCLIWHYGVVEHLSGISVLVESMVDPTTRSLGGRTAMESDAWDAGHRGRAARRAGADGGFGSMAGALDELDGRPKPAWSTVLPA